MTLGRLKLTRQEQKMPLAGKTYFILGNFVLANLSLDIQYQLNLILQQLITTTTVYISPFISLA